jgi:hypothetical protein
MLLAHAVLAQCCLAEGDEVNASAHAEAVVRLQARGVAAWADEIAARVTGTEHISHG